MNYATIHEITDQLDDVTRIYADALTVCVDSMVEFISLAGIPPSEAVRLSDYLHLAGKILVHRDEVIHDTFEGKPWSDEDLLDACIAVTIGLEDLRDSVEAEKEAADDIATYLHGEIDELIASSLTGLIIRYLNPVGELLADIFEKRVREEE